jgi:hypothetical protein
VVVVVFIALFAVVVGIMVSLITFILHDKRLDSMSSCVDLSLGCI